MACRLPAKPYRVSSTCLSLQNQPWLCLSPVLHLSFNVSPVILSARKIKQMGYSYTCLFHSYQKYAHNFQAFQGSQEADYWKIPKKIPGSLPAWHPSSLSLRSLICPFTSLVVPLQPRVRKGEMWSRRVTPFFFYRDHRIFHSQILWSGQRYGKPL